jgi:dihydropteroate synthase
VVARLVAASGVPVSIDTTKARVARDAIEAGATVVNDVTAGRGDDAMLGTVAETGVGYVAMHMLGEPRSMQDAPHYDDVVREVGDFLMERLDAARAAGIVNEALVADPGIGFGKTVAHNLTLLARLDDLVARVRVPVLVGTSRKRFLGAVLRNVAGVAGDPLPEDRDEGTLASVVWALDAGARIVRVHEPRSAARAVALLATMRDVAA